MDSSKRLTQSYIVRLAGCAECLNTRLALCANEKGYMTNHLMARRALIGAEKALQGIKVSHNALWSRSGDFYATVKYEGQSPMMVIECLKLSLSLLSDAQAQIAEYLDSPTAIDDELPMFKALLEWVTYCQCDIEDLIDSPKPLVTSKKP